jgi:hypothetical protein
LRQRDLAETSLIGFRNWSKLEQWRRHAVLSFYVKGNTTTTDMSLPPDLTWTSPLVFAIGGESGQ